MKQTNYATYGKMNLTMHSEQKSDKKEHKYMIRFI